MTNTTIPAESLGSPSEAAPFYRWEVADKPIAIHLSLDLLDRLEREVLESFKAVTKRGSEIGGVLVGHIVPGETKTVMVERFEPVECDYSRGPLYLLSDDDKVRLKQVVERVRSSGDGDVAGFFRSNTRRDIILDEDDLAIATEYFSDPHNVFLLVRPYAMKPSAGAFFFWENGQIQGESSYLQFPFKRAELLKNFAQYIVAGPEKAAGAPPAREPLVMPRREERPIAPPPISLKREETKPPVAVPPKREDPAPAPLAPAALKREEPKPAAAPPKREEPPALTFKREERPAIIPVTVRREEPAPAKRDDRPPTALRLKREERAPIAPAQPKREERLSGPTLVSKREELPAPPAKKEEPAAPPPVAKREERPPITVKREEKVAVVVTPPKPVEEKPVAAKQPEAAAPAKKEEPAPAKAEPVFEPAAISAAPAFAEQVVPAGPGLFSRLKWVIIGLVLVLVAVGGFYAFRAMKPPAEEAAKPADSSLALKVERSAGQLLLSWNRSSSLIATATRATLSITDGDHKEDVDLDLGQLHNGSIVYAPMTNDVSFRLEVTDLKNGKSLGESVRVLAGRPSPTVAAMPPTMAKPAPGMPDKSAGALPGQTSMSPAPAQATPQQETPPAAEQPKVVAGPAVTAAPPKPESLASRLRAAEPQELPAPPTLEGSSTSLAGSAPVGATQVPAAPPVAQPAAQPPKPAAPQTQAQAPVQQPASRPAAQPVETGGRAQEARLTRRVAPVYPALARQTRVSGVVRVRATVGKDGKVKKAVALSGPPLLRQAAAEAVHLWLYSPAMLNGEPVESETQVDVNFMM